jgi:hypothetical protein
MVGVANSGRKPTGSPSPPQAVTGMCSICQQPYGRHSGKVCEACLAPIEHHRDQVEIDQCWENRARMAICRRDSGLEMNRIDREAIRRHPEPGGWVGSEISSLFESA